MGCKEESNEMKKISVIVPVYNVEKYVSRCLDSILSQDYENLDVICVNDGSTDGSLQILQQYAEKDKRVRVFSQENGGISVARNRGMTEALGEYVSFIDADDYIEQGLYSRFVSETDKDDVDVFMFNGAVNETGRFFNRNIFVKEVAEGENVTYRDFGAILYGNSSACNKIFNLDFLRRKQISFLEGKIFEDIDFWFAVMVEAKEIKVCYECYYQYVFDNPDSVTKTYNRNVLGVFDIFDSMMRRAEQAGLKDYFNNALFQFQYEKGVEILYRLNEEFAEEYYLRLKSYLQKRQDELVYKEVYQLFDYHLCHNVLYNDYIHFKNTFILFKDKFHYVRKKPKTIRFSLIVPVYNVEEYLDVCLKSIINQTYENFEVICINDGSTDGSYDILKKHAKEDARIKIINQENKGLSAARNIAVKQAVGEYLVFVDSDDWLRTDALELLNRQMKNQDLEVCFIGYCDFNDVVRVNEKMGFLAYWQQLLNRKKVQILDFLLANVTAWGKVYSRRFWLKNNISFPEGVYFEDNLTNAMVMTKAKRIGICWNDLYYYRRRRDSITMATFSDKKIEDLFRAYRDVCDCLVEAGVYSLVKEKLMAYAQKGITYYKVCIPDDKKEYYEQKNRELMSYLMIR